MTEVAGGTPGPALLYRRAMSAFGACVDRVGADQWALPTPCSEWDVRALVGHVAAENCWVPLLLAGATVEEVGDRFEGDVLGEDPAAGWTRAADEALAAVADVRDPAGTVHVSYGDIPVADYLGQLFADVLIHTWDLATAIGVDRDLDRELVAVAYEMAAPMEEQLKSSGHFGDRVVPPPASDLQTRLLAIAGRRP